MKVVISLSSGVDETMISESAGRSQKWFDGLPKKQQREYLAANPKSKFNPKNKKSAAKAAPKRPAAAPAATKTKSKTKSSGGGSKRTHTLIADSTPYAKLRKMVPVLQQKAKDAATKAAGAKTPGAKAKLTEAAKKAQKIADDHAKALKVSGKRTPAQPGNAGKADRVSNKKTAAKSKDDLQKKLLKQKVAESDKQTKLKIAQLQNRIKNAKRGVNPEKYRKQIEKVKYAHQLLVNKLKKLG